METRALNLTEYQKSAARTELKNRSFIERMFVTGMGLGGEACELLALTLEGFEKPKVLKELGDVMWYVADLCTIHSLDLSKIYYSTTKRGSATSLIIKLAATCGATQDYLKKVYGHGHELDTVRLFDLIRQILSLVSAIASRFGSCPAEVCDINHQKRLERYPDGFSSERSINRVEA